MRKSKKWFASVLCLLLAVQLTACQSKTPPAQPLDSVPTPPPVTDSSSTTPVAKLEGDRMEQVMRVLFASAAGIYSPMSDTESPTKEQENEMLSVVAALGVPVRMSGSLTAEIRNHQVLVDFCAAVKEGKDAEVYFYTIDSGGVSEDGFVSKEGKLLNTHQWREYAATESSPDFTYEEELEKLDLWSNGWMVWKAVGAEGEEPYGNGFRVIPQDPALGGLFVQYVAYLAQDQTGVLSRNWDEQNLTGINWNYLFEVLLARDGKRLANYSTPPLAYDDASPVNVPAADVEELLMRYFPITEEQLRTLPGYRADTQTYEFVQFQGGGYSPIGEVTQKIDNPDGSFTLRVDWTSPDFFEEVSKSQHLTIMPDAQGSYRYVQNKTEGEFADAPAFGTEYGWMNGILFVPK